MLTNVVFKTKPKSTREATLKQVEEHWNTSNRKSKSKSFIEKKQEIVKA